MKWWAMNVENEWICKYCGGISTDAITSNNAWLLEIVLGSAI